MSARNDTREPRRIAIFQYEWPLQAHTLNLARKLAQNEYQVDLFLKDCRTDLVELTSLSGDQVSVRDFSAQPTKSTRILRQVLTWIRGRGAAPSRLADRVLRLVREVRKQVRGSASAGLPCVDAGAVDQALACLGAKPYCWFIGVEKQGLIWAGRVAEVLKVPYLYYSLELYLDDCPGFVGDERFPRLRAEERWYHQRSSATIIQDRSRADALLAGNAVRSTSLLYLPVALDADLNPDKSSWVYAETGIPRDKKVLLYFGMICANRRCQEIAQVAGQLPSDWTMVFHGHGPAKDIRELSPLGRHASVVLSLRSVPASEIRAVISSATIGLVLYDGGYVNDRLTAFSSEKIALYLQSGIPIIGFDMGNYRELTDRYACGVLIKEPSDLPSAVATILADYERYREAAFSAFRALYQYDNYFPAILAYLDARDCGASGSGNSDEPTTFAGSAGDVCDDKSTIPWVADLIRRGGQAARIAWLKFRLETSAEKRIIVGAGGTRVSGWIATQQSDLDLLNPSHWDRLFKPNTLAALLAEHVWEHLDPEDGLTAAKMCHTYLRPGGYFRIAVPDGFHPDPRYIDWVRPGGSGDGSHDHKILYTHDTLKKVLEEAGFEVVSYEYFDELGAFHYTEWSPEGGPIARSMRFDERNRGGRLAYTSIVMDAFKRPPKARMSG